MKLDLRYVLCRCWSADHFVRVDTDEDFPDELNIAVVSTRNGHFWHRVRWALKHVFGRQDLIFADVIVSRAEFRAVLEKEREG